MKKFITILLTTLMVFTLVGCGSKKAEEQPVEVEPTQVVEPTESETVLGGWVDVDDGTLTDELKDIFSKALDGLLGSSYEPIELLATQVVNGTNYKFLASGTKTTNPITVGKYNVTINESSDGTISLLDIETIEEKQEEVDPSKYSYWVVFYDQFGNELQRTVEKYGTVPEYKSWLPAGFEKWVYKKTQKDVDKFKAIVTNTYFEAICHEVDDDDDNYSGGGSILPGVKTGTIITLNDGRKYKVLALDGTKAKVLSMKDIQTSEYWVTGSTNKTTTFNSVEGIKYEGSTLDTCLTNWYNSLDDSATNNVTKPMHDAIQSTTFTQRMFKKQSGGRYKYQYNESDFDSFDEIGSTASIERYVYALDVKDVYDYFGKDTVTSKEIWNLFYDRDAKVGTNYIWLASASGSNPTIHAWIISEGTGSVWDGISVDSAQSVRPAFTIDLKADGVVYTIVK